MIIEVTKEDIQKGRPSDACRCPVAMAITRALGVEVTITSSHIKLWKKGNARTPTHSFVTPYSVVEFVGRFDAGDSVSPFKFELPISE